jgi:polysaccharide biosynthesis transport protein
MDNLPQQMHVDTSAAQGILEDPYYQQGTDISLISIWRLLLRRRAVVASVIVAALLVGIALAFRPPQYVASGSLQVRAGSSNMYRVQASELTGTNTEDRIETEVGILQSSALYSRVAEQLHLESNPEVAGKLASEHRLLSEPRTKATVIARLRKMIHVERTPKTEIITVTCKAASPLLASQIVNTLMNQYIERIFEVRFGSTQHAAKFLSEQMDDLKNQVLDDQKKLVDLQSKLGVVGFDDTHNLVTAQLEDLARANEQAKIERIISEARYRILQDESPNLVDGGPQLLSTGPQNANGSLLQTLRSAAAQLATQYANISEQFGPNYPDTRQLKAQLDEANRQVAAEQARVLEQAKVAYQAALRNQQMTMDALTQQKNDALQDRNDMVRYQILLHDYQASRTLYEELLQRLREAGVVSGLESAEIELIDLADPPVDPAGYGRIGVIGISLALGAVFALILSLLLDTMDTSIKSVDELERYIKLPALAVLPTYGQDVKGAARNRADRAKKPETEQEAEFVTDNLEVLHAPQSYFAEGLRLLRSSLLLSRAGERAKVIVFTSSLAQEGKSTISANEACLLAQDGKRVLLIDADLRRPGQHTRFGLSNRVGLSTVLAAGADLKDAIKTVAVAPSLQVLTSGPLPPSPGDLLASDAMRQLIHNVRVEYDFVVVDTPPSSNISDSVMIAELSDVVVLVVRAGAANKKLILRLRNSLSRLQVKIVGFVFNAMDKTSEDYYEYKHYGYDPYGADKKA